MKLFLTLFISLFNSPSFAGGATDNCTDLLSRSSFYEEVDGPELKAQDGTLGFTGYMGELLEGQVIGDKELIRLIEGLEQGELRNPLFKNEDGYFLGIAAGKQSAAEIHHDGLQEYISDTKLNLEEILVWARENLQEKERVRKRRSVVKTETRDIYQRLEFHPIPAGSFEMGEKGKKVATNITRPFEMGSTQVTQKQWVDIMGENPSYFKDGEHTIVKTINGKSVKMQPDNPVENITWWSMIEFANRLSQKAGFEPVYDTSGIKFSGRAEDGTLRDEENSESLQINQTNGYRLPTEAEWEYVVRALGQANGEYHFGDKKSELGEHAWFSENSDSITHPVSGDSKKPLIIDGYAFYGMHGNVSEWVQDWYGGDLKGGDDPRGPSSGWDRALRGGSWGSSAQFLRSAYRNSHWPNNRNYNIGFRLARALP